MIAVEEFLQNFHALEGKLPGQRQAAFRKNLDTFKKSNPNQEIILQAAKSLTPRTNLEETLKIDFLIEFKLFSQLLEILKGEKIHLIKKVIKEKWLWQEAFETITTKQFIEDLLPNVSYVTRKTILNRLAALFKNESLADEYYEETIKKYGAYETNPLLPCCSQNKILHGAKRYGLQLPEKHVLTLVKKDYNFFELYLKTFEAENPPTVKYAQVMRYLAINHTETYVKLENKYKFEYGLNWKASKALLKTHKKEILEDLDKYSRLLHMPYVFKSFKNDFDTFFLKCFPVKASNFNFDLETHTRRRIPSKNSWSSLSKVTNCLIPLSYEERFQKLSEAYQKLYGVDILRNARFVNENMMPILPKEQVEKWVEIKYREDKREFWYKFLPVEKSVPLLKKKINLTSDVNKRKEMLKLLVGTCAFNKHDQEALLDVLKYFFARHKNDVSFIKAEFLTALSQEFDLEKLSQNHWEIIIDLVKLFELNDEYCYEIPRIREKYIIYLSGIKKDIKDEVLKCLEGQKRYYYIQVNGFKKNPSVEKAYLKEVGPLLEKVHSDHADQLKYKQLTYCEQLYDWNIRHPEDPFDLLGEYSKYLDVMKKNWKENLHNNSKLFHKIIDQDWNNLEKYDLYDFLWLSFEGTFLEGKHLRKLLFVETDRVLEKAENLTCLKEDFQLKLDWFWILCAKFEHLGLPQKIVESSRAILKKQAKKSNEEDSSKEVKRNDIKTLALFLPTQDFIQEITDFLPVESTIPIDINKDLLKLQENIIRNLRWTSDLSKILPTLIKFCVKDYLKLAHSATYFLVYNLPENKTQNLFDDLSTKSVTIRKHVVSLKSKICSVEGIVNFLRQLGNSEKDSSIRKFIIKNSLKVYFKNPSPQTWDLLISNSTIMDADDEEAFNLFVQYNKFPKEARAKLVELAWNAFEKAEPDIQVKKYELLKTLPVEVVSELNPEFCLMLIRTKLFSKTYSYSVLPLARKYVITGNQSKEIENRMSQIFLVIKNYIDLKWSHPRNQARGNISTFVDAFCHEALEQKSSVIIEKLSTSLSELLPKEEYYRDYVKILLSKALIAVVSVSGENVMEDFAEVVIKCLDICIAKDGSEILIIFYEALDSVLSMAHSFKWCDKFKFRKTLQVFCENFQNVGDELQDGGKRLRSVSSLLLHLLPGLVGDNEYDEMREMEIYFSKIKDSVIRIQFNNYLKNLTVSLEEDLEDCDEDEDD